MNDGDSIREIRRGFRRKLREHQSKLRQKHKEPIIYFNKKKRTKQPAFS